jgi:DMSO/TMAO reductase YedYZ molybdopterin-dependent catalytic subunit
MVAAGLALATGELLAGIVPGIVSPVVAVGTTVIDLQPPGAKEVVVALFGEANKLALNLLVVGVVLAAGAGIGVLAVHRPAGARGAVLGLVAVGLVAGLRDPSASLAALASSAVAQAMVGTWTLGWLVGAAIALDPGDPAGDVPDEVDPSGRRRFLVRAGALGITAIAGGGIGRMLTERRSEAADVAVALIPAAVDPAPAIPAGAALDVPGISPLVVPNDAFYRIDTALVVPAVDPVSWRLRVHGLVEREVELTFEELVALPLVERHVTIACVSNEVGGDLVGNAKWTGVRLTDVLDLAGIDARATQIVGRSVDGWTAGFPTAWVTDRERDALVAVKMNDDPLPAQHGFPARLIVPGLYGYVSATKWLTELELTTLEAFDAYWIPRGWAKEAPILTQSRIDVPRAGARLDPGPVAVAGVAWAPDRGISAVEVRVDDGPWRPAVLAPAIGPATWVQWRLAWEAPAGPHVLAVRATDGTGEVQTSEVTRPDPDGARGHHEVRVTVG